MSPLRLFAVLLAFSLSACIIHVSGSGGWENDWSDRPRTQGSGVRASETRTVEAFERVRASTSGDVRVVVGGAAKLSVSCDDNLIQRVRTRVVDGELIIDTDGGPMRFSEPLRVEIACPKLEGASLAGSGSLRIEGLAGERFDATLSGSGELEARGSVARVAISLTGSGDVRCGELAADDAQVSLAGSGDVHVSAKKRLSASISGSGDVRYRGGASEITRSVAGSGTIAPE